MNKEIKEKIKKAKEMLDSEDIRIDEVKVTMTVTEFKKELLRLNQLGRTLTLKHREEMPAPKDKKKKDKNYHLPGTKYEECSLCKEIIDAHNSLMRLQANVFGLTGIPYNNLMAAIKITEGLLKLIENEKGAKNE